MKDTIEDFVIKPEWSEQMDYMHMLYMVIVGFFIATVYGIDQTSKDILEELKKINKRSKP